MEQKKKWKLFDTQREGRGVDKADLYTKTDLKGFFLCYKSYFTRLLSLNLLMVIGNFPLIFGAIALATWTRIVYQTPLYASFPLLNALLLQGGEIPLSTLLTATVEGGFSEASAMTPLTYALFALSGLAVFTFGVVNAGTTYVLRNMVRKEPVFIFSDFFYAVKKNWKQALPFGILDAVLLSLIPFNIFYLATADGGIASGIMLGITIGISVLYCWMRFYIYLQMVTFDLPIRKILKNALLFTALGFKRNLAATVGILLLVALNLILAVGFSGIFSAAAILLPIVLLFSNGAFMSTYAAYFKIKEVMIDPYEETEAVSEESPNEEPEEE